MLIPIAVVVALSWLGGLCAAAVITAVRPPHDWRLGAKTVLKHGAVIGVYRASTIIRDNGLGSTERDPAPRAEVPRGLWRG